MKQFLSTCLTLTLAMFALVQNGVAQSPNVLDGAYVKETNLTKRVIPYPHLREADVMYKRRIWQEIDLRQKFNHPFYFPLCLLYTSPSPRDQRGSRMPSSA